MTVVLAAGLPRPCPHTSHDVIVKLHRLFPGSREARAPCNYRIFLTDQTLATRRCLPTPAPRDTVGPVGKGRVTFYFSIKFSLVFILGVTSL